MMCAHMGEIATGGMWRPEDNSAELVLPFILQGFWGSNSDLTVPRTQERPECQHAPLRITVLDTADDGACL